MSIAIIAGAWMLLSIPFGIFVGTFIAAGSARPVSLPPLKLSACAACGAADTGARAGQPPLPGAGSTPHTSTPANPAGQPVRPASSQK